MNAAAVDASVWVAAADATDARCAVSRQFFATATRRKTALVIPSIALVEVGCALARRTRDVLTATRLVAALLAPDVVGHVPVDAPMVARALKVGTERYLRGADAFYVAVAEAVGCVLVSWDREHLDRGGGLSPETWLRS